MSASHLLCYSFTLTCSTFILLPCCIGLAWKRKRISSQRALRCVHEQRQLGRQYVFILCLFCVFMWKWWTIFAVQILKMMDNICKSNSENDGQYLQFKFWKWLTVFAVQILMDDSGRLVLFPLWTVHKMCVWLQRFGGRENVWLDLEVSVFNWVFCQCHRFWSSSWLVQCHRLWNSDDYAQ